MNPKSRTIRVVLSVIIGFVVGAVLLCFLSFIQKTIIGANIVVKGFIIPFFYGGTLGAFIGVILNRLMFTINNLRNSETNLKEAERIAQLGHFYFEASDSSIYCSKELYNIIEEERKDFKLTRRKLDKLVHPEDVDMFKQFHEKAMKTPGMYRLEHRILLPNKKVKYLLREIEVRYNSKNELQGVLGIILDITILKQVQLELLDHKQNLEFKVAEQTEELTTANEELHAINDELFSKNELIVRKNTELESVILQLKETQTQLIQAEKMASLGILTAGIAHEINNPLNFIQGGVYGLESYLKETGQYQNTKIETWMNGIQEGVDRTTKIITGLNQFSRSNEEFEEHCDVHSMIDNCLIMLNNKIKDKIEVFKYYTDEIRTISGNVGKLHQAFLNIICNACQAIENKGFITIKTSLKNEMFCIEFIDSGIGIEEERMKYICDPFYTTKDPGEGTGLGLSITYNIVKEHNGAIYFNSEIGKGTTVTVMLPI